MGLKAKAKAAPRNELPSRGSKPAKSILKKTNSSEVGPAVSQKDSASLFTSTKKDKRLIKHAQLMNKVAKSSAKKPRRRRPNKKLVTTLDSLADALPDSGDEDNSRSRSSGTQAQDQVNIIKRKSMKSKPGAMKRREKLDKSERDRFAKNMAQLAGPNSTTVGAGTQEEQKMNTTASSTNRWAALRGFISQTLETKPELQNAAA